MSLVDLLSTLLCPFTMKTRVILIGDGFRKCTQGRSPVQPGAHAGAAGGCLKVAVTLSPWEGKGYLQASLVLGMATLLQLRLGGDVSTWGRRVFHIPGLRMTC